MCSERSIKEAKETRSMKKFLILMLALLLCLPTAVACQKNDETPTPPPAPAPAPVIDTALTIATQEASEYQIVIAKDAEEYVEDYAYKVRLIIRSFLGVSLPVVYDTEPAQEKEIVFGKTNRQDLYTLPLDYKDGYVVCVCDQRLIFEARTVSMMKTATSTFVRKFFGVTIDFVEVGKTQMIESFKVAPDYMISNDTAALYQVIYDGSYMQKRYAYRFQDQLKAISMSSVVMVDTKVIGNAPQITMEEDSTLERGHWRIEVAADQKSFKAFARDYYGFTAVSQYLIREIRKAQKNVYPFEANAVLTGSHVELLDKTEASTAYVYNRTAEHRVMFYNALWGDPSTQERNGLVAEMIIQYMPDVIGMQEMNNTKRTGKNAIPTLLAQHGYVESIDPRVENVKSVADGGWGTLGGIKVMREDGSFYYTYMNCTPLFYNQNTTNCIYSEYYWYKNQIDKSNEGNCGVMDCASKALTWGVFESKATGDRYIVISTHMCTRSNGVRGEQAKEAVELINKIIAPVDEGGYGYNYPIFFGGDFNGQAGAGKNYLHFVNEAGYVDIRDKELPTIHNSQAQTMHGAPVYDEDKEMLVAPSYDNTGTMGGSTSSVDHIFLANGDSKKVDITVFGVVIDECSRMGSDHLPIFTDFSIS